MGRRCGNKHYKNLPMQNIENFFQRQKLKISLKNFDVFDNFIQNIDCGYTLEPPR